jgi:purine-binding chemotaxis protein CheW
MNMADPRQKTNELRLACFSLEGQNYAVDIMKIRQIIRPAKIRPLPQAPDFIEGVINLRGAVIPVMDLRKRFKMKTDTTREPRIIIVSVERHVMGVVVDDVSEVISVSQEQVQPAPQLSGIPGRFLAGACQWKDDILLLLNLDELLTSEEKESLAEIKGRIRKE